MSSNFSYARVALQRHWPQADDAATYETIRMFLQDHIDEGHHDNPAFLQVLAVLERQAPEWGKKRATIKINRKTILLGRHKNKKDAVAAREKAIKSFGL